MQTRIVMGIGALLAVVVVSPVAVFVSLALVAAAWFTMDAIFQTAYRSYAVTVRRPRQR